MWACFHFSFFQNSSCFIICFLNIMLYLPILADAWCVAHHLVFGWFLCQFGRCYVFTLIIASLCLYVSCSLQGLTLHSWRFYSAVTLCSSWIWIQTPSCILLVPWNQVLKVWIQISHHRYVMPILQITSLFSLTSLVIYAWWYVMPNSPGISECDTI